MKLPARLLLALVVPLALADHADAGLDPAHAWFKPALTVNRSPLCPAVLEQAHQLFYSSTEPPVE